MNINIKVVNFLKVTVLVSSLLYFGYFIFKNFEQFKNFSDFNLQTIAILISLKFINIYLLSNLNIFILKNIGINLKNTESIKLTVRNTLGNLSSPLKLGSGYKLSYLKEKYDIKINEYLFITTFYSIFNLIPIFLIFLIFSFFGNQRIVLNNLIIMFLIFFGLVFATLSIKKLPYFKKINTVMSKKLISKNNLIIQFNNILFFLSSSIIVYLIIINLSNIDSFYSSISYNFLGSFVNIINLTPGNIGIKEGLIISFNNIHNISFDLVIITSFIERFLSLIALFVTQIILRNNY